MGKRCLIRCLIRYRFDGFMQPDSPVGKLPELVRVINAQPDEAVGSFVDDLLKGGKL